MKIFVFCFALFLSRVLSDRPVNVQVAEHHQCIVNVSESSIKLFNESLENGKKVIYFRIHYDSKQADALTKSKPNDHFANPNEYMWLYDGVDGLPVYMNAPYNFEILSLFILNQYTSTLNVNINVSKSCNVSRVHFLRLVFQQLIQIVSTAHLPDKRASAYVCYEINNRKNLPEYSFMAYKRLGINREIINRYCCKVKNIEPNYNKSLDLCPGHQISSAKCLDLQNYIGAFLFAFFPLAIVFISKAKMPWYHAKFDYIRSVSGNFHKGEQFVLPFGTESCWINEHDDRYSIFTFLKWLFLFNRSSLLASRIRRSSAVFWCLLALFLDFVAEYFIFKKKLKIYLDDNIPLGYKSIMFGYKDSVENTDNLFGGPFVWFSAFVILGLIVINIPDRLCQTIAYSTLHQRETCTFLAQDIKLLQHYGSVDVSNLHDYDLLHAILKSSLLTALNPSFWFAVIKRWFGRCKRVYNCFNNSRVIYQLIGVCVTFLSVFISLFLCVCELLLCIVYYGCPQLVIWKAIPHSYTQCYICPVIRRKNLGHKLLGLVLFLISLPVYLFLFVFSTYLFLTSFQLVSSYVMYTVIALIAKPDAIAYVLLTLVFFYFVVSIVKSISETYQSLLRVSIQLADSVSKDFVYTRLEESFIYAELFEQIVERHHPIRYEVAKALTKLVLALMFFISCVYAFDNISLNLSTYIKIGLIILTSMIPRITTVLNDGVLESRWKIERILETIYYYKLVNFDIQNYEENGREEEDLKSIMKLSVFCFALFLSRVLSDRPVNVQVAEHHQCIVNVSESSIKLFNESLENGKKVIYFRIHYDSKQADALTKSKPNDHFANPNEYMWLYDGVNGLPVYMNAPYDFDVLSLFILKEYTSTLKVNMNVSKSCNESLVSRVHFLRLVFQQLIQIVSTAHLPDKRASAYVCYEINNRKNLPEYSFMAYKRLGINREIINRYCCKVKNIEPNYNKSLDLCPGHQISSAKCLDLQNYIGAFLFAFFPLAIVFISKAKMPWYHAKFDYIRSVSGNFHKGEQFVLPFGTESCWINEHDDRYSIFTFLKWLFLFNRSSLLASRIRRSSAVFWCLLALFLDFVAEYFIFKKKLKIYLDDNIPLGYKSIMFGYKDSVENTDNLFGGPFVWFSAFVILGLIVINIPDRLCQTIAYSTLHQRETCTFLAQDIKLLQHYGSLDVSNLHDYDLLHAILKSSLLTALNPSFWFAVIKRWFGRCKRVYNCFNNSRVIYQLIGVCVTFLSVFISLFLCICELLLCIVYYGCPQLVIWKAIPHSYTQCYICPVIRRKNLGHKLLGLVLFLISLPVYLFLFVFSTYLFLTSFQLVSSYVMYTVIALIAKPDAIAYVLLTLVFFYFVVSIVKSISETYQSLLRVSIQLADSVSKDFVYTRLEESFIYAELFEQIVERHHPIRYEVAKALTKLVLALMFFISCVYAFDNISLNLSTYIKIGLIILTSMIPRITTVLNDGVLESRWKIERILETIYYYKLVNFDIQNYEGDDFYPSANTLGMHQHKDTENGVDRMVTDLERQINKREKYSRRRAYDEDADIDYINERNMKFNKKLERFYGKYTAEIKQNLERGTAV